VIKASKSAGQSVGRSSGRERRNILGNISRGGRVAARQH
jgi:hypothetical protein